MLFTQSRVRVVPPALAALGVQGPVVFAVGDLGRFVARLTQAGFSNPPQLNSAILPSIVGPATRFNAEGKIVVRKDLPKETAYRQIEWSWEQWNGPYTETVTEIREVPYQRYPRELVPPPGIELSVLATLNNDVVIATPPTDITVLPPNEVCHRINLLLEIFGECEVLNENMSRIVRAPITRLNWRALPPGVRTWQQLQPQLQQVINNQPPGNQAPLIARLKLINDQDPDMVAIGEGGFRDYVVFGFTQLNLFILESPMLDNATYVFGQNWNTLAQLTKTDLIAGGLMQERIVHRNNWATRIKNLF